MTNHCIDCCHLQRDPFVCTKRAQKIKDPSLTKCANHNDTTDPIRGPLIAFLDEKLGSKVVTHFVPYWRTRRPIANTKWLTEDTGVFVFDDGLDDYRSFESVSEYIDAYLDEYRAWETETIRIPVRTQLRFLVVDEWRYEEEWAPHFHSVMQAIIKIGDVAETNGRVRLVFMLLECYFQCENPDGDYELLEHQSVLTALMPFIEAARARIPEL